MDIEVSKPFKINFDKNEVIDKGFEKAFYELTSITVSSKDKEKIVNIKLSEIKAMIESFSLKEEKFINETYYLKLNVSFNRKNFFDYLENLNIFPTIPIEEKFLFIPIIIDEKKKDLLIFTNNMFYKQWNNSKESFHLIEYILPTEDLEDLNLIKKNFTNIEEYDFLEITDKYYLNNYIVALIFKNESDVRVLSKIKIKDKLNLKNRLFSNINFNDEIHIKKIIDGLKINYEDYWKYSNQINTSIKLPLTIKINSSDNDKISKFEASLSEIDLISDFYIIKFDKDSFFYQVIFNGAPSIFLKIMGDKFYEFDTQNKIWILK